MSIRIIRRIPVIGPFTEKAINLSEAVAEIIFNSSPREVQGDYQLTPTQPELTSILAHAMMILRHQAVCRDFPQPDGMGEQHPYWWDSHSGQWSSAPEGVYFNHHLYTELDELERDARVMLAASQASRALSATNDLSELFNINTPSIASLQEAFEKKALAGAYDPQGAFWAWGTIECWNDDEQIQTVILKTDENTYVPVPAHRIIVSDISVGEVL